MKKIVLTAFEPFGSIDTNITIDILNKIKEENKELKTYILPVVFNEVGSRIKDIINQENPDYLIMMGQAEGSKKIRLERNAINYVHALIKDNNADQPQNKKISETDSNAYFTTFDDFKLFELLDKNYVERSYTAGTYVCNYIYYEALSYLNKINSKTKAIFIHYPLSSKQASKLNYDIPSVEENILFETTKTIIFLL